jgi:pimeloyl-ACP methyl ester carboxylesterase
MTILLHGALASARQFDTLLSMLPDREKYTAINLPGHGGRPLDGPFSLSSWADDILAFMDQKGVDKARFWGYSMGGYVALYMAWKHPDRVEHVTMLNTKLDWSVETSTYMMKMVNPDKIRMKVPALAEHLAVIHAPVDWSEVALKTADFMASLGAGAGIPPEIWPSIACPIRILLSENDQVVAYAETAEAVVKMPQADFSRVPNSGHGWDQIDLGELVKLF